MDLLLPRLSVTVRNAFFLPALIRALIYSYVERVVIPIPTFPSIPSHSEPVRSIFLTKKQPGVRRVLCVGLVLGYIQLYHP
jgi:hypothetical protein